MPPIPYPPPPQASLRPRELSASSLSVRPPVLARNGLSLPASPRPGSQDEILIPPPPASVVRLANLRSTPVHLLWNLFTHACAQLNLPPPSPFSPPADSQNASPNAIWAVFPSPRDARAALVLSCDIYAVSPAVDSDFAPTRRLNTDILERERDPHPRRAHTLPPSIPMRQDNLNQIYHTGPVPPPLPHIRPIGHNPPLSPIDPPANAPFTLSSNPPNPKTTFRAGDWMCSSPACSAHNFQRNTVCIACGRPRSAGAGAGAPLPPADPIHVHPPPFNLANPSPRFAVAGRFHMPSPHSPHSGTLPPSPMSTSVSASSALAAAQAQIPSKAPPPQYPPLTPSGRALSVGGRVRNISRDPLQPCVMYWPDNEPLPEKCQIRPIDSALITFPPIINTGNKGAAEKQPGDWLCGKCNYHNWRRRKVCQTCYPYAEGNGDSISAAVQAERIALLANVLSTQFNALDLNGVPPTAPPSQHQNQQTSPTSAPPYTVRFASGPSSVENSRDTSPDLLPLPLPPSAHDKLASPIYQTSGVPHPHSHPHAHPGDRRPLLSYHALLAPTPNAHEHTLLPSFLHDIVTSPSSHSSQSPSPTSSSSTSFEGSSSSAGAGAGAEHYILSPSTSTSASHSQRGLGSRKASESSFHSHSLGRNGGTGAGSIWKMDGEETWGLSSASASASTSARTSPTAAFAHPSLSSHPTSSSNCGFGVGEGAGTGEGIDSGTTPKTSSGFWQVRYQ